MGQSLNLNVNFLYEMVYFIREKSKNTHKEAFFRALLSARAGGGLRVRDSMSKPVKRFSRYDVQQLILLSE